MCIGNAVIYDKHCENGWLVFILRVRVLNLERFLAKSNSWFSSTWVGRILEHWPLSIGSHQLVVWCNNYHSCMSAYHNNGWYFSPTRTKLRIVHQQYVLVIARMHNRINTHIACDITHHLFRSAGPPVVIYNTSNRCIPKILEPLLSTPVIDCNQRHNCQVCILSYHTWTKSSITRHKAERWLVRLVWSHINIKH